MSVRSSMDIPKPNDTEWAVSQSTSVAKGEFGYVCHYVAQNCDIAIKVLRSELRIRYHIPHDETVAEREYELLSAVQSDHIVKVIDFRAPQPPLQLNDAYVIMEYMYGGSLGELIKDNPLSDNDTKMFALQLLSAVEHIHGLGVIHHDIQPSNILLDGQRRRLKLAGFGLATKEDEQNNLGMHGTVNYMAPEFVRHEIFQLGPKCDIWSVGATIIHMRTGRPPFHHLSRPVIISMWGNHQCGNQVEELNDQSDSLGHFIAKLMAIDPDQRPTATEARDELRDVSVSPPRLTKLALAKALVSPYTKHVSIPHAIRSFLTLDSRTLPMLIESLKCLCPRDKMSALGQKSLDDSLRLVNEVIEAQAGEDKVKKLDQAIECIKGMKDKLCMQIINEETISSVNRWLYCIECVRGRVGYAYCINAPTNSNVRPNSKRQKAKCVIS